MTKFMGALLGSSCQLGLVFRLSGPELRKRGRAYECSCEGDEECSFHVIAGLVVLKREGREWRGSDDGGYRVVPISLLNAGFTGDGADSTPARRRSTSLVSICSLRLSASPWRSVSGRSASSSSSNRVSSN